MRSSLALVALLVISATAQTSVSVITARPHDPEAVYLTGAAGDGTADDSEPVQHAIDTVHDRFRRLDGHFNVRVVGNTETSAPGVWSLSKLMAWSAA